jgi:hypothetical protein
MSDNVSNTAAQTQQRPQKVFHPEQVQESYTDAEWKLKEKWYSDMIMKIAIPVAPTLADFQNLISQIDYLYTIASLDNGNITRNYDRYKLLKDIEEDNEYLAVQNMQMTVGSKTAGKLTVKDIESLVTANISKKKWGSTSYSLYEIFMMTGQRMQFMKDLMNSLNKKNDRLIMISAGLKLEHSITAMQPSVPNPSVQ